MENPFKLCPSASRSFFITVGSQTDLIHRIYNITYMAADCSGNSAPAAATFPLNRRTRR